MNQPAAKPEYGRDRGVENRTNRSGGRPNSGGLLIREVMHGDLRVSD